MFRGTVTLSFVAALLLVVSVADAFVFTNPSLLNTNVNMRTHHANQRRSRSSLTTMMAEKNRRARRVQEGLKKKSPKTSGSGQPSKSASDAKWLQVLDETPEMEAGSVKVVSAKYKGNDQFFALATHGGRFLAVSEACGRCKFPMVNGKVKVLIGEGKAEDVKAGVEEDPEADVAISCPLCGAMFDMTTGAIAGEQPVGFAQQLVSKVVSASVVENVKTYQARALSSGAIVVRVD